MPVGRLIIVRRTCGASWPAAAFVDRRSPAAGTTVKKGTSVTIITGGANNDD